MCLRERIKNEMVKLSPWLSVMLKIEWLVVFSWPKVQEMYSGGGTGNTKVLFLKFKCMIMMSDECVDKLAAIS